MSFRFQRALALQNENHEAGNKYIPYGKWLPGWLSGKTPLKRNGLKIALTAIATVTERP